MRYIISFLLASVAMPALAQVPNVVTDIPPVQALVATVMGDLGQPTLLLERGASAHDFSLRPSQARAVAGADLVVLVGPEMTPWIGTALQNRQGETLGLLAAPGTHLQDFGTAMVGADDGDDGHDHAGHDHADHDHDHDHDHEAGHDHAGHVHSGRDPHAWLDPANGKLWLELIAAELSRLDPGNAATYAANAKAGALAIDAAEVEARALLDPVKDRPFAVFHDAYGYYTRHYGLKMAGTVAFGDAATPGAKRLAALKDQVAAGEIRCIFPEAGHDPALVALLAEGGGLKVGAALDPEGAQLDPGPALYTTILTDTAAKLADCLKD